MLNFHSEPFDKACENAFSNITNAIDTLFPVYSKSDFETERDSMLMLLNFLLDQLKYLIIDKHARCYNILTQVFCFEIHRISPAGYLLIQDSNCVILPHERNLLKMKNGIGLDQSIS